MNTCPNCSTNNLMGALFCKECGGQLLTYGESITQSIGTENNDYLFEQTPIPKETSPSLNGFKYAVSLHLLDAHKYVPLSGRDEFTVGRASEEQSILPDVDISPFGAYEKGVSRMHVSIKSGKSQVTVTDLGSVNGTRLNGVKIVPNQAYPLKNGDILLLGKFRIQVLTREAAQ